MSPPLNLVFVVKEKTSCIQYNRAFYLKVRSPMQPKGYLIRRSIKKEGIKFRILIYLKKQEEEK